MPIEFAILVLWPFTALSILNALFVRTLRSVVLCAGLGAALALAYLLGQFNF